MREKFIRSMMIIYERLLGILCVQSVGIELRVRRIVINLVFTIHDVNSRGVRENCVIIFYHAAP